MKYFTHGSDGAHTDNYENLGLSLHERHEIIDPIFIPQSFRFNESNKRLSRYSTPRIQISQEKWQEIASRKAAGESLRQLAEIYKVSHETVRQVVKKVLT